MKKLISILLVISMTFLMTGCLRQAMEERESADQNTAATAPVATATTATIPAVTVPETTSVITLEPVVDTFLEDWINLLSLREQHLAQENYTLGLILALEQEPVWENFLYARTACYYTCNMIDDLAETIAKPAMTDADYQELMDMGMDVADVQAEYQIYNEITRPEFAESSSPIWREYYMQNLVYDCFDADTMKLLLASAQVRYDANVASMRYWYLVNNYILLELPEDASQKLLELAQEHAPVIMAQYGSPFASTAEVLSEMDRSNDALKECLLQQQEILSAWELLLQDPTLSPTKIDGLPVLLPFPECVGVENWIVEHYWSDADIPDTGDYQLGMHSVPDNMFMAMAYVPNITEVYEEYVQLLEDWGFVPVESEENSATYVLDNGAEMFVHYNDGLFSVWTAEGFVCFAPMWYIQAIT